MTGTGQAADTLAPRAQRFVAFARICGDMPGAVAIASLARETAHLGTEFRDYVTEKPAVAASKFKWCSNNAAGFEKVSGPY